MSKTKKILAIFFAPLIIAILAIFSFNLAIRIESLLFAFVFILVLVNIIAFVSGFKIGVTRGSKIGYSILILILSILYVLIGLIPGDMLLMMIAELIQHLRPFVHIGFHLPFEFTLK
ncbi:MAG: hypothetical protein WCG01_03180 [bacterium]